MQCLPIGGDLSVLSGGRESLDYSQTLWWINARSGTIYWWEENFKTFGIKKWIYCKFTQFSGDYEL